MFRLHFLVLSCAFTGVAAQCNVDDHHPENGGYFFVGAAGISSDVNLDSAHGQKLPNNTWAIGVDYPYGQNVLCEGSQCSEECATAPGCPFVMASHTCSILRFCPPEGATPDESQAVYLMKDEDSMNACDFTTATEIGRTLQASSLIEGCVEYVFEEDHETTMYYFSSPEGCNAGQKLAVDIDDFAPTADQCAAIGNNSPRIRTCDCRFELTPSVLGEPCRTAFSDQCEFMTVKEGNCCEEGSCLSRLEDYNDPLGKEAEDKRQAECDDAVPGLCYNEDGLGTDTNREGSVNCCTRTCSECGILDNPFAQWKACTSGNAGDSTANCGFLSRYDQEAFVCDFSLCNEDDHWHPNGEALKTFFNFVTEGEDTDNENMGAGQTKTSEDDNSSSPVVARSIAGLIVLATSWALF